jgi:hypothetical protein
LIGNSVHATTELYLERPLFDFIVCVTQLFIGRIFDRCNFVICALYGNDEFGELDLKCFGIAILGILNQKEPSET